MQRCHRASGRYSAALSISAAGIRNDQLHAREAAIDQASQKRRPTGFVLLGALADAENSVRYPERKVAEGEAEMAKAASHRDAAKERRERLQRGEDVPGGLGKPLTREDAERIMREAGMTTSDIQHCVQVHDVSEAIGFETLMKAIHDATHRAERNIVRTALSTS